MLLHYNIVCIHAAVDKEKVAEEEDEDEYFTADEGRIDEHGRLISSSGYLEKLKEEEKERKLEKEKKRLRHDGSEEIKSATKLELQFELDEVRPCCIVCRLIDCAHLYYSLRIVYTSFFCKY